jgi:nitroreductase
MDVLEAIRRRRSSGAFAPSPLPRETIERLLEAAVWAPNHHLTEPWRFHVVAGEARGEMAEAVVAGLDEGQARSIRTKLQRSPAIVILSQRREPDATEERDREDYAACACAAQNLLLAAEASGLAAKWSTGELAESPAAKAYLGLPEHDRIVAYLYVGYPADGVPRAEGRRGEPPVTWHGL